ncbi:MAG: V-type ATP synthase subunit D, partial [Kiritimatiellia bacterium]|nr:V-type ATP synthase subunit D [Kiritimatiellia bacterium]
MARIRHTKNELKAQRDALKRFERYLPMLQLKKQQLQMELRRLDARVREKRDEERKVLEDVATWVSLFSEPYSFNEVIRIRSRRESSGNIAGVTIPILDELTFERIVFDLHFLLFWVDDGIWTLEHLIWLRVERR